MTDAIDRLQQEHRLIGEVLASFETFVECPGGGPAERATLHDFAEFFQLYMGKFHDAKEEDLLFRRIYIHGFRSHLSLLADLLGDHLETRKQIRSFLRIAERPGPFSPIERREVSSSGRAFAELVREHIQREDSIVFPIAVLLLPAPALEELAVAFDELDRDPARAETIARLEALARHLIEPRSPAHRDPVRALAG